MSLPSCNDASVEKSENKRQHLVQETVNDFDKLSNQQEGQMGVIVSKLDSSNLANGSDSNSNVKPTFFGVHVPNDCVENRRPFDNVFTDKLEALKALKKNKKARFKVFTSRKDAEEFVLRGAAQPMAVYEVTPSQSVGEKPVIFKGPKSQDLVRLRKSIESGDLETVQTTIWDNPRFLVSSGDTPTILQEGSRYNALHVAAKAKNVKVAEFIIVTIGEPSFVGLLYGDDNAESCNDRARILLDLYLNTPDKGLNETPLHFAVKFGAKEVVEVLVACPQCDRNSKNKYDQTAKDMICSRDNSASATLKQDIAKLLEDQYYVPVLRSEDNSSQPVIGRLFSPVCPLVLNTSLMDSRVQIQAFAGPMNEQQATVFRKKWKTPPRSNPNTPLTYTNRRLKDPEKGLECVGRNLAAEFGCEWKEYWSFIDTFTDLTTAEGLEKLDVFFKKKFAEEAAKYYLIRRVSDATPPNPVDPHDRDDGPTALKQDMEPLSPMSGLCYSLNACSLLDRSQEAQKKYRCRSIPYKSMDVKSQQEEEVLLNLITKPGLSPFLCVEKSCHVYGKRIADGLQHMIVIGEPASDMLKQEVKHLQTLICSYMDDARFVSVDFHLVHSRIASIVNDQLRYLPPEECDLITSLCVEITANNPSGNYCSSDEEELNTPTETYRSQTNTVKISKRDASMFSDHIKCIVQQIQKGFSCQTDQPTNVVNEEDCMQLWSDAVKCSCHWQTQCFLRNSRKGSSYKRLKYKALANLKTLDPEDSSETDGIARRLCYDQNQDSVHREKSQMISNGDVAAQVWELKEECDTDNEEDSFFTPPSSLKGSDSSQDDAMSSAEEDEEVYIDGHAATSTDLSVFHAIENCHISMVDYPNVYRWRHMMMLLPTKERENWTSRGRSRPIAWNENSTPTKGDSRVQPIESWHRVVNPRSPASPQFKKSNFKYNRVPFSSYNE